MIFVLKYSYKKKKKKEKKKKNLILFFKIQKFEFFP